MTRTIIIDYDMGNLRSVQKALERVGCAAEIAADPNVVATADKLILPGVGAFQDAIAHLRQTGLDQPIIAHINAGKPFLGICLGMQLLFAKSYEDGEHTGLGVFAGEVVRFPEMPGLKVPHMGWNHLHIRRAGPLFEGIPNESAVYFVHCYYAVPKDQSIIATETDYPTAFTSAVWKDNVFATQFHPEKSQDVGLRMLQNFALR